MAKKIDYSLVFSANAFNKKDGFIYYVPFQILANRDLYIELCQDILKEIKKRKDRCPKEIIIITSTDCANYACLNDEYNSKIVFSFPHLSFINHSNVSFVLINVPESVALKDRRKFILSEIKKKIMLRVNGYLYGFESNRYEYLTFNLSIQANNKLNELYTSSGTHGKHITPFIYSNELQRKSETKISDDLKFFLPDKEPITPEKTNKLKGLKFRILLIDDKIKSNNSGTSDCKAELIKKLLTLDFEDSEFKNRVCWKTPDSAKEEVVEIIRINTYNAVSTSKEITGPKDKIQIIAVKNLTLARQLLADSNIRFDMIMMDYLLDNKNGTNSREYATEFWTDGKEKYFEFSQEARQKGSCYKKNGLVEQYNEIKANRGPMQKLWIFPITAFNQTFTDDLRNKGVNLIDYYWYLSRGADPINTPYLFIYSLNKFLQLQLDEAVFSEDDIRKFLIVSVQKLKNLKNDFNDFIGFMGREYSFFSVNYFTRPIIYRDMEQGSLFAKYIWDNFFSNQKYKTLFNLLHYIEKFYHACAFGTEAELEKMIFAWKELNFYIEMYFPEMSSDIELKLFYEKLYQIVKT